MSTSVLAHLPMEAVGQSLKHKSISRRALGPGSDCHRSDEGRESPVLSTCRVRSGNGSRSPQTTLEGEDGGDAGGFAQGALHRARACALGFLSRKQLQLTGPHLHLRPAAGASGEAWAL